MPVFSYYCALSYEPRPFLGRGETCFDDVSWLHGLVRVPQALQAEKKIGRYCQIWQC
jgi:hypothetical protein